MYAYNKKVVWHCKLQFTTQIYVAVYGKNDTRPQLILFKQHKYTPKFS